MRINLTDGGTAVVRFHHERSEGNGQLTVCAVRVDLPDGTTWVMPAGIARCHPVDQFCYEVGRRLALTRAIQGYDKPIRREIWVGYFAAKKNGARRAAA